MGSRGMGQVTVCPRSPSQNPSWWHWLWMMAEPQPLLPLSPSSMPHLQHFTHRCQLPLSLDQVTFVSLTPLLQWQVPSGSHPSAPSGLCNNLSSFLAPAPQVHLGKAWLCFSEGRVAKHTKTSIIHLAEGKQLRTSFGKAMPCRALLWGALEGTGEEKREEKWAVIGIWKKKKTVLWC